MAMLSDVLVHTLICMQFPPEPDDDQPWQYRVLLHYGALLLAIVGLLAMGFGAAGIVGTVISAVLLPIGFICLVAGVVLPRIEGSFTAGPSGLSANLRPISPRYTASGPALEVGAGVTATADPITLGDVWDALAAAGFRPYAAGMGHAYLQLPDGRSLSIPNRRFYDHGIASDELLAVIASWGVHPVASGKYPTPSDTNKPTEEVRPTYFPLVLQQQLVM